ncbi:MAG: HAMP domain-containing sensor histidine kinase [Cyclobacteriaceae bacterium]|nr:HAMP domain-containing sensor histidine kinase [Cyclobacteriaceae bacterium]
MKKGYIFVVPNLLCLGTKSFSGFLEKVFAGVLIRVHDPLDKKRVMLAIGMALSQITIYLGFFFYSTLLGYNSETTYYTLISAGMIALMLVLTYYGHFKFAMIFGLILSSIATMFIVQRVGADSGTDHYYVLFGIMPFGFFGYKDRILAFWLTSFAFLCFILARTQTFSFIEPMKLTQQESDRFLLINSTITFFLASYSMLKIMVITNLAEKEILRNNAITLVQNEELKRVNHELDKFVYSASHDLSAPLKSIAGLIQITKMESLPPTVNQYLDLMHKSVSRLETFIHDIVNYSRNSRMPIKHEKIDIFSLVKSIWEDHLDYTKQQSKIELHLEDNLSSSFYSDETRLRIIFNNLLSNAIKFHLEEKRERPYVKVVAHEHDRAYVFDVADNGRGMNAEIRDNIFKMFFRGISSVPGSGLGLYILKESVEKLNGEIEVESEEDKGSSFKIRIPKSNKNDLTQS